MYAGTAGGWLGGPCISYRGAGQRRAALHNPVNAYQTIMGIDSEQFAHLIARQNSINDLVRDQLNGLMNSSQLSSADQQRLQLHFDSIRDLENTLMCNLSAEEQMALEGGAAGYASDDGDQVLAAVRAHMDVAVLAVIRTVPFNVSCWPAAVSAICCIASRIVRAGATKAAPVSVSDNPRGWRWNRSAPSCVSMCLIWRPSVGWLAFNSRAAADRLPVSATARKA